MPLLGIYWGMLHVLSGRNVSLFVRTKKFAAGPA
jgi:hypothetical protein